MELADIQQQLAAEEFDCELQTATADLPQDHILVALYPEDEAAEPWLLQITYVPGVEHEMDDVKLLQYYVALDDVAPAALDEARRLLTHVNQSLPIMAFNLHEQGRFFYFRHVLVLPRQPRPADAAVIVESVWLTHYQINGFSAALGAVARGEKTAAELLG